MANITMTVYDATRLVASAPNVTDNKTGATSSNTYLIPNNGRVVLVVQSTAGATITVATPGTVDGNAIADLTFAAAATKQYVIGPFPPDVYNNSAGQLSVTVSANTDLLAARV